MTLGPRYTTAAAPALSRERMRASLGLPRTQSQTRSMKPPHQPGCYPYIDSQNRYEQRSEHLRSAAAQRPHATEIWALFLAIFAAIYFASLFTPPLLDDVDASHAEAAQYIAQTGDWITAQDRRHPLHRKTAAALLDRRRPLSRYRRENTFATHLPNALAMLGLTWLAWLWAGRAWGPRAGLYAGLGVLTSVGPFLFTRFIIPESILAFFLLLALYCLHHRPRIRPPEPLLLGLGRRGAGHCSPRDSSRRSSLSAPPFPICCSPASGAAGARSSRSRDSCSSWPSPRRGTSSAASPIPTRAIPSATTPPSATSTASSTSTSSTSTCCASSAMRYPHDYNKLPTPLVLAAALRLALSLEPVSARRRRLAWKTRRPWLQHLRHDAGQTVDFYLDNAAARRCGHLRCCASSSACAPSGCSASFTAWTLLFFSHLHQPGVLHLPGLAAAASSSSPA